MWSDTLSLVAGVLLVLGAFSWALILILRQFSQLLSDASSGQVKLQSEALATILAPVLVPKAEPVEVKDLPEEKVPEWRERADSPDLVDDMDRVLDWSTIPVIPEEQTVGPADLWAKPTSE